MPLPELTLNKGEEHRLLAGHLWVFSNEINTRKTPLSDLEPGQEVTVLAAGGQALGSGYVNPNSLISVRLYTRTPHVNLDRPLLKARLRSALQAREHWYSRPYYRLAYGESDGLPGLVIDRYGSVCTVQTGTAGMEARKADIIAALDEVLAPDVIFLKNDSRVRSLEALESYTECVKGTAPQTVCVPEYENTFTVPLAAGQKTGWFYDHHLNRGHMRSYASNRRVLDVFSYVGSWGIGAAAAGASHVTCIEVSGTAIDLLRANIAANELGNKISVVQEEAFAALKELHDSGQRFDIVVLDPPAFIKRKKDVAEGRNGYRRLNALAMRLLTDDGQLISASCSYHLRPDVFLDLLQLSAQRHNREVQVLHNGHQAPDHPVHPAIPETNYLKCYFCRLTPRW